MYNIITIGMADVCSIPNSNTLIARKVNLSALSFQLKFLNLSASNSRRDTSSKDEAIHSATKGRGRAIHEMMLSGKSGRAVMNKALAGVGRPLKESDCEMSVLKTASRIAENAATAKAT